MKISDIKYVVLINLISILFIYICYIIYKKRQPMTVRRMRKEIKPLIKSSDFNPFANDFSKMRMMLAAIDDYVPPERTIASLLVLWHVKGLISLEITPKKHLKSFGEQNQESIRFITRQDKNLTGAEKLFFEMLSNWTDESDILQKSELYQLARQNSSLIFQRIEQFIIEGKHGLRATGQMQPEKKRRHFGFLDEQRPIFTSKGVRQAAELKSYQAWLKMQNNIDLKLWSDAVLLEAENAISDKQILNISKALSQTIMTAANAGKQSKSLGD